MKKPKWYMNLTEDGKKQYDEIEKLADEGFLDSVSAMKLTIKIIMENTIE